MSQSRDRVADALTCTFGDEFAPQTSASFDLTALRSALAALGDPHLRLPPTIHVAGTNGKGSVCAFLASLAEAHGLRTHVFTKPHLRRTAERVRLAGREVDDETFLAAIARVAATAIPLRHFEAQMAAAFVMFAAAEADLLILETGMGGRDDASNVIARPALALITPIARDHTQALGETVPAIAAHKAGIIKSGAPALTMRQEPAAMEVIEAHAARMDAPLLAFGRDWDAYPANGRLVVQTGRRLFDLPAPSLAGPHQFENAGAAVAAMDTLTRGALSDDAAAHAVAHTFHPARLQRLALPDHPHTELWIDGAHNAHAAAALAAALAAMAPRETILVLGMLARKDPASFLAAWRGRAARVIAVPIAGADCIPAAALAAEAIRQGFDAAIAPSLAAALAIAARETQARVLITGSLALCAEALDAKEREPSGSRSEQLP